MLKAIHCSCSLGGPVCGGGDLGVGGHGCSFQCFNDMCSVHPAY